MRSSSERLPRIDFALAVLLFCLWLAGCACAERGRLDQGRAEQDLSIYRLTNGQAGHEFVKTEQFLVPVGSVIVIEGLEFAPGASQLTKHQELIVQQVFNSLEEITENTVGDTNFARVAEYKKMEFEIRGYPDHPGVNDANRALAEKRAQAVLTLLTYFGTPPWRLKATHYLANQEKSPARGAIGPKQQGRVEFIRTK